MQPPPQDATKPWKYDPIPQTKEQRCNTSAIKCRTYIDKTLFCFGFTHQAKYFYQFGAFHDCQDAWQEMKWCFQKDLGNAVAERV